MRVLSLPLLVLTCGLFLAPVYSQDRPSAAGQFPELASLPDQSAALQKQIDEGGGSLLLKRGVYRLTKTLEIDLAQHGAVMVKPADGGVTLIMDGPGPAIRLVGSHEGTASPHSFDAATWRERMPIIEGIEIVGNHPEAVGIELYQTVQPIVSKVAVRWCQHGIVLAERNRNVIISDSHLYENSGVGIYLDDVNLHQINISNSHVSYNREGGIVVRDGNVRNLHITGCDIEGNMPDDGSATDAANIWLDVSGSPDDEKKSIAEVAITGCTIQHSANRGEEGESRAPGGANIRLSGKEIWPIDSVAITGNVISDTTTNVVIDHAMDITLTGNTFFAPKPDNLLVTHSQRVIVSGNTFNPRQWTRPGTIRFVDCEDSIITNSTLNQFQSTEGAIILENCVGMTVSGLILSNCKSGIVLKNTTDSTVTNCKARGLPEGVEAVVGLE